MSKVALLVVMVAVTPLLPHATTCLELSFQRRVFHLSAPFSFCQIANIFETTQITCSNPLFLKQFLGYLLNATSRLVVTTNKALIRK
jgi:hypothetical protein